MYTVRSSGFTISERRYNLFNFSVSNRFNKELEFLFIKSSSGDFFVLGVSEHTWSEKLTKKLLNMLATF